MLFRTQARAWARNPPIPLPQYSSLINDLLEKVATYQSIWAIAANLGIDERNPPSPEVLQRFLELVYTQFTSLKEEVDQFEAIKPNSKELLELHVRAVGFFRCFLTVQDRSARRSISGLQGNFRDANKMEREYLSWKKTLSNMQGKFYDEMESVKAKHPALYNQLHVTSLALTALYDF